MSQSYSVLQLVPLPVPNPQYVNDIEKENEPLTGYETIGGVLYDTKYIWSASGPHFTVVSSKTGSKVAAWSFGALIKDHTIKVVCVDELHRPTGKLPLLVIGLESGLSGGFICIFDITGSRILRAVQIDEKVTSLHVINSSYDKCPLPGPLRAFDGILAVGTSGGDVLLLDVYLQTCDEVSSGLSLHDIRDEINSCFTKTILLDEVYSLELHKQIAIKNGEHLTIHLNAPYGNNTPHFILKGPTGEDRVHVNKEEVKVSALHYCPQLGSLLIGYNFGAWQLWNLIDMQLIYTSPVYEENIPVSHFAIQEPCDDPRAFCYVWVVYSNTESYQTGFPVAVLYSLNYDSKEWHEGYGILYQNLTSCAVRFQTDLTFLDGKENENIHQGAQCLRLQAIHKSISKGSSLQEHQEESLTLCSVVWRGWRKSQSNTVTQTFMSLFDLNQWYKEQMPSSLLSKAYGTYITHVCLSKLLHFVNKEPTPFLDVRMDVNTLSQFFGSQKLEEHYYPSSLAFQLCGLRKNDIVFFNNQGSQRALLSHLEFNGPVALLKPEELCKVAIDLGLHPLFIDIPNATIEGQRELLLSIGLEQQLLGWLCRCASVWSSGSYSAIGCSLQFLLAWGWQRAHELKQNADRLSIPLFDYSGIKLDANTHSLLINCSRQLKNLTTLFGYITRKFARFLLNPDVIKQQWESLQMVSVHLEVLQWLLNIGLLPECPLSSYPRADEYNRISAPYPVDNLIEYYDERRTYLQSANKEQFSTSGSLLFIDNLIELECGGGKLQKQWENDGGNGLYPPPSLQALLRTYLIEEVDISSVKHCVVVYVFLDLAMTLDQSRYKPVITHLIKFPAVFQLSPSVIKITQAFWQLDHGDFSTAMEQLLDPLVFAGDLKMWHHRIALKALLAQDQHSFALLYLQVRQPPVTEVQDLCTVLSLFIANNMLDEAFNFQRQNRSFGNQTRLLHHFYQECDRKGDISSILYLPLTATEEEAFMKYLQDVDHPKKGDLQIFFYIQRSQYMDAFELNDKLNAIKSSDKGLKGQANVGFRDLIIKEFGDSLPEISKSLISLCKKEKSNLWKQVERPEPFSVFVHNATERVKYKSSLIQAVLSKAKETWTHPVLNRKNGSGIHTEETPFLNTPKAATPKLRITTPIIFPRITKLEESRQGDFGPSPAKNLKLSPRLPLISPEKTAKTKDDTISNNMSIKLDTPIIKRKLSRRSNSLRLSDERFTMGTPQSILKIYNLVRNSQSPDIDSSPVDNVNIFIRKSNDSASGMGEATTSIGRFNLLSNRSSLGLTPRKPLSSRHAVRFDISRASSESSLTSNASGPTFEIIEDQAIVHTSVDSPSKLNTSLQSVVEANSKNSSLSVDEVFYSPNASTSSNTDSKQQSGLENIMNVEENIVLDEQTKIKMEDNSESPRARRSFKRRLQNTATETNEIRSIEEVETPTIKETVPGLPKTPRSRRSYKGYLPEVAVRSSPRLKQSLIHNRTEASSEKTHVEPIKKDTPILPLEETHSSKLPVDISQSYLVTESPYRTRIRSRRSLTRQVLENNTFSKAPSPVMHLSRLEVSHSKTETAYESIIINKETKKQEHDENKRMSEEVSTHTESLTVTRNELQLDDELSSSYNPLNIARVSDFALCSTSSADIESSSETRENVQVSSTIEDTSNQKEDDLKQNNENISDETIKKEEITAENKERNEDENGQETTNYKLVEIGDTEQHEEETQKHNEETKDVEHKEEENREDKEEVKNVQEHNEEIQENREEVKDVEENKEEEILESIEGIEECIVKKAENLEEEIDGNKTETSEEVKNICDSDTDTVFENNIVINCANLFDDLPSDDQSRGVDPQISVYEITSDEGDLNKGVYIEENADILEMETSYITTTTEDEIFVYKSEFLSNLDVEEFESNVCEKNIEDTAINETTCEEEKEKDDEVQVIEIGSSSSSNSEEENDYLSEPSDNSQSSVSTNSEDYREDSSNDNSDKDIGNRQHVECRREMISETESSESSSTYQYRENSHALLNEQIRDVECDTSEVEEISDKEELSNNIRLEVISEEVSSEEPENKQSNANLETKDDEVITFSENILEMSDNPRNIDLTETSLNKEESPNDINTICENPTEECLKEDKMVIEIQSNDPVLFEDKSLESILTNTLMLGEERVSSVLTSDKLKESSKSYTSVEQNTVIEIPLEPKSLDNSDVSKQVTSTGNLITETSISTNSKNVKDVSSPLDILDVTEHRTPIFDNPLSAVPTDILEKTELCTPESLNVLNQTDILDSTMENSKISGGTLCEHKISKEISNTPVRRTRRSSSLQATPVLSATKKKILKSNSYSDLEKAEFLSEQFKKYMEVVKSSIHEFATSSRKPTESNISDVVEAPSTSAIVSEANHSSMLSKKYLSSARFDCSTPRESLNALYQTDILDVTDDAEASSSSKNLDILEKSEFCTPVDSLNTSKQTDILDSIVEKENSITCTKEVEKMFTPGRRSKRSSSLQPTPLQSARKLTRRNSTSTSLNKTDIISEASTSKDGLQPISKSTRIENQDESNMALMSASPATPFRRKRSTSFDTKNVPLKRRILRSSSIDAELKNDEATPSPRTRSRAPSAVLDKGSNVKTHSKLPVIEEIPSSDNNEDNEKCTPSSRIKKSNKSKSVKSSRSESETTLKQPRKSKSTIAAVTKGNLEEYSTSRRLTRKQAELLKKTLQSSEINIDLPQIQEEQNGSESDDSESHERAPNVGKIDPIKLLDKPNFEGKPDSDEERNIQYSPLSSVPESPVGSQTRKLRSHSSVSNTSLVSEDSHSEKKKSKSVKRVISGKYSTRRQRNRSIDTKSEDRPSPPKLRRTRKGSQESESNSDVSHISKTQSLIETKKATTVAKRTRSNSLQSDQPELVESPLRRSERRSLLLKSELPKIDEESSNTASGSRRNLRKKRSLAK